MRPLSPPDAPLALGASGMLVACAVAEKRDAVDLPLTDVCAEVPATRTLDGSAVDTERKELVETDEGMDLTPLDAT